MPRQTLRRLALAVATLGLLATGIAVPAGCARREAAAPSYSIDMGPESRSLGGFKQAAEVDLQAETPVVALHVRGDTVFAYTKGNKVYALGRDLSIRSIRQVVPAAQELRPPVVIGEEVVFPSQTQLEVYTKSGGFARRVDLPNPLTSDVTLDPRGLLLAGTATPTGGRLSMIDPTRKYDVVREDALIGNVIAAPVGYQGEVFAATDEGNIFAIAAEQRALWPLPGGAFRTDRAIRADLVVDDFALYVAGTDSKLYALDRGTGKIKWTYYAEGPLTETPFVTRDRVYQVVPETGLVALHKTEGEADRAPLWTLRGAARVLAADDAYVFVRGGDGQVVAVDKASGRPLFALPAGAGVFARNTENATVYAAQGGKVMAYQADKFAGTRN